MFLQKTWNLEDPRLGRENLLNLRQVGSEGVHQQGEREGKGDSARKKTQLSRKEKASGGGKEEERRGSEPQPGRDSEDEGVPE